MSRFALILFTLTAAHLISSLADAADRPNILFAISDDQSYPHCSAYGCNWVQTPAFDRVAANGLLFNRCYTPNAKCAPSRGSILTGRHAWLNEDAANHVYVFPSKFTTYVEALNTNGYSVGYVAKGLSPATYVKADGSRRSPTGEAFNKRKAKPPAQGITNNDYAANFNDFLDSAEADKPWCFWYGGIEPHRRYEYGAGVAKGGKSTDMIDEVPGYWPDNEVVRNDMLDYAFEIEHFDSHLGRMLDELESRGQLENTLVVVTSDNGMPFPRVKGNAYERSNHLPLAIMWGAGIQNPGRVIDDFVSFVDFAPTFLDVAGVSHQQSGMQPITGHSLRPLFEESGKILRKAVHWGASGGPETAKYTDKQVLRDSVLIGKERHDLGRPDDGGYPIRGLVDKRYTYIRNFEPDRWPAGNPETGYMNTDGGATKTVILDQRRKDLDHRYWNLCFGKLPGEELYDRQSDPECINNLAGNPAYEYIRLKMSHDMTARLAAQGDPRTLGKGQIYDTYPYAQERLRDYYKKFTTGWKDEKGRSLSAGWINETDIEPHPLD